MVVVTVPGLTLVSLFVACNLASMSCFCEGYSTKTHLVHKSSKDYRNYYYPHQQEQQTKFFLPRVIDGKKQQNNKTKENNYNEKEKYSRGRRQMLKDWLSFFFISTTSTIGSSSIANAVMYENAPVGVSDVIRLSSGTTIQDLRLGDGPTIDEGQRVNIQWSLKRSNGYIIDSSSNHDGVPFIFIVGNTSNKNSPYRAIQGLDDGIRGMKVGGIRRIIMPPSQTYVEGLNDGCPGPIPPDFGPKQRIDRVMKLRADVPDESFLLDIKPTRIQ